MNKPQSPNELYEIRTKLSEATDYLENSKKKMSNANYMDLIKSHGKTFRLKPDIITKLHYTASWGDQYSSLYEVVMAVQKPQVEFAKRLKAISTNIVICDIILGPVKSEIVSPKISENSWYYILKRSLILATRSNEHAINAYERRKSIAEEAIRLDLLNKQKLEKKKEEEEKKAEETKANNKLFDFLNDHKYKNNWDDSDNDSDTDEK